MHAMPLLLGILCLMAIAYRYYSAFLAARVAVLDDARRTPAMRLDDGQNYHPTSKWVLFGHHFAAISGAGPLIGPVLAAQFGYMPGLLWIVIGVCLAGAVQDFLVLAASVRRGGKSLAQIAFSDLGRVAGTASMVAILFIVVIALAGLGKVVVKALGGEKVRYPAGSQLVLPPGTSAQEGGEERGDYQIPAGTRLLWPGGQIAFQDRFTLHSRTPLATSMGAAPPGDPTPGEPPPAPTTPTAATATAATAITAAAAGATIALPADAFRKVPGSSWGTFTIACTIPIALFVGLYMYRIRRGRVVEASLIGAALTIAATVAGAWVARSPWGPLFNWSDTTVTAAMAIYGFVAAVLPVWVLLLPRDYLSSFLKIGTIALLVVGTLIANPVLKAPAFNEVFKGGGPTVPGHWFPFLFITIMCGAASGFHALVSSGTTPKMVTRESHTRAIGYGAMLIEGLVAVVAMIAAAALPVRDYYGMNTDLAAVPKYQKDILRVAGGGGVEHVGVEHVGAESVGAGQVGTEAVAGVGAGDNLAVYEDRTKEALRGRTGGAVTLAVGMAEIFTEALHRFWRGGEAVMEGLWKYWYHFAIMFEALFILTTIDAGTRIGRFLLQEVAGKLHPALGRPGWWPGAVLSTALIVAGWAYFISANSMAAIWPMFGIANQMLVVIALAIVSAVIFNEGRSAYLAVTVLPLLVVLTTTTTAAVELLLKQANTLRAQGGQTAWSSERLNALVSAALIVAMLTCAYTVLVALAAKLLGPSKRPAPTASMVAAVE